MKTLIFLILSSVCAFGQNLFPGPGSPLRLDTSKLYPQIQPNPITTNTPDVMTNVIQAIGGGGGGSQVWTNDGTFTSLASQGGVDTAGTNVSPSLFVRTNDGSIFFGHNVGQDTFLTDPAWRHYHISLTDSNDAAVGITTDIGADNENYDFTGSWTLIRVADPTTSKATFDLDSAATNGNAGEFFVGTDPNNGSGGTRMFLSVNSAHVFDLNSNGLVTSFAYSIRSTTNQITFGATNTAPTSTTTPSKWISVQVNGESAVYRLPLYQ